MMDIGNLIAAFAGIDHGVTSSARAQQKIPGQSDKYPAACAGILCFSKARPFQLEQFILSLEVYVSGCLKVLVLYHPGGFNREYEDVLSRHPAVLGLMETEGEGFSDKLDQSLSTLESALGNNGVLCVCVDDLIFTAPVNFGYVP
jgi:hypothetical protein